MIKSWHPPIRYGKTCSKRNQLNSDKKRGNIYTNMGLAFIEDPIHKFLKDYYIPAIEKLGFHLYHVQIIGKKECGETRKYPTKPRQKYGNIRVVKDYAEK